MQGICHRDSRRVNEDLEESDVDVFRHGKKHRKDRLFAPNVGVGFGSTKGALVWVWGSALETCGSIGK
jgi:hypothetical protein